VLVLLAVVVTVHHAGGLGAIVHARPKAAGKMTFAALVGLGVAKWLGGAIITPDVMRFGKGYGAVVISTAAEFLVGNLGFNLLGLVLGLGLGASDLGKAFGIIGLTWLASVTFVIQSITVEMNELYAASLAVSNAARVRRGVTNIVVGVVGIAIGWYGVSQGIIASFLTFINWIGYALPIIPAIIIADYFIVQRMRYPYAFSEIPAVNWRAMAAFVVTLGLNIYLGVAQGDTLWHSLPLIGIGVYLVLSVPHMVRSQRGAPVGLSAQSTD
jgi:cytosine permease